MSRVKQNKIIGKFMETKSRADLWKQNHEQIYGNKIRTKFMKTKL